MNENQIGISLIPDVKPLEQNKNLFKRNIVGMSRSELSEALLSIGTETKNIKMRQNQIWSWVYQKGIKDFNLMSNISKEYRGVLNKSLTITRPTVTKQLISKDGTRKSVSYTHLTLPTKRIV